MMNTMHHFPLPDNLIPMGAPVNREKELGQLQEIWDSGKKAIFITGLEDSGKTELAIAFGQLIQPGNAYLIRYHNTLRSTVANLPLLGYIQLPNDWSLSEDAYEDQRYEEKLEILQHYYSDSLFIIDGADVTIRQEPEYDQLMSLNARFIFTIRSEHCADEDVHLFKRTNFTQTLQKKLEDLTPEQRRILCCAALLSDYGLQKVRFLDCVSDAQKTMVDGLLDKKLLAVRQDGSIVLRPDIREKYLQFLHPTDHDCADFLSELACFVTPVNCYSPVGYMQVATCFVNASNLLRDDTGLYALYVIHMFRDCGDYLTIFPFAEKRLAHQLALQPRSELDLAWALCEAGTANFLQTQFSSDDQKKQALKDQAFARIQEGVSLYEKNLDPSHPDVAEARMALAYLMPITDIPTADEYAQETIANQLAVLPDDHPDLCSTYLSYATRHYCLYNRKTRFEYAYKALRIMQTLDYAHKDLPLTYLVLAGSADTKETRLEYALKALEAYRLQTPWDKRSIYSCLAKISELYRFLSNHAMQKFYLEQAIDILEKTVPPTHIKLRQHYKELEEISKAGL